MNVPTSTQPNMLNSLGLTTLVPIQTSYDASLIIKTKFNLRFVRAETNKRFFITLGTKRASCNSRTPKDILKDMVPILVIG